MFLNDSLHAVQDSLTAFNIGAFLKMTIRQNTDRILLYTTLLFSIVFMTGCPTFNPSRTYDADLVNYEPSSGMTTAHLTGHTVTIQANAPWQPSGVQVVSDDTVKILALGKWSQAPGFNVWSGPEGLNGTGKEVPWINANALMGKIGDKGKPFEVGSELELRAKGEGEI